MHNIFCMPVPYNDTMHTIFYVPVPYSDTMHTIFFFIPAQLATFALYQSECEHVTSNVRVACK